MRRLRIAPGLEPGTFIIIDGASNGIGMLVAFGFECRS